MSKRCHNLRQWGLAVSPSDGASSSAAQHSFRRGDCA
jgi:hypothetical protein